MSQNAIEEAIDNAYLCGQIDALSMLLVPGYDPTTTMLALMQEPGGFERRKDELLWSYMCWCLAHNCAVAAMAQSNGLE